MYLRYIARAMRHGSKGAIVISIDDEGVHMGIAGLQADELRYTLCAAIDSAFEFAAGPDRTHDLVELPGAAARAALRWDDGEDVSADETRATGTRPDASHDPVMIVGLHPTCIAGTDAVD